MSTISDLAKAAAGRCWDGYEPVPGKDAYSDDSCRKIGSKKKKKGSEKKADSGHDAAIGGAVGAGAGGATGFLEQLFKNKKSLAEVDARFDQWVKARPDSDLVGQRGMEMWLKNEPHAERNLLRRGGFRKAIGKRIPRAGIAGAGLGVLLAALLGGKEKKANDCHCYPGGPADPDKKGCKDPDCDHCDKEASAIQELAKSAASAAWQRKSGKNSKGGLNEKGRKSYEKENPGSDLKAPVTGKVKPGGKAAKRRKSFCARMSGNKGPMKKPNGEPTRKALSLRKWKC